MADNDAVPRTIEEREARITQIDTRLAELDAEFDNTVMTDEARDEWNLLNQERDQHATAAAELRRRKERMRQLVASGSVERAQGPAFVPTHSDDIYDLHRIRVASHTDEDYRSRLRDNALRSVERSHFAEVGGSREDVQAHIEGLLARCDDQQGTLARMILATGSPAYDRAFGKAVMRGELSLTTEERAALSLTDANGGLAVPYQLDPTVILTNSGAVSALRQIARVEPITSKTWQGITSSGITVSRSNEGAAATGNEFTIAQPEVTPTRVIADVQFSVEVDQDWSQMRGQIATLLADAKEVEEDTSFVTGDGTAPAPSGVVATLNDTSEVDLAGTFALSDIDTLEGDLPVRFRRNARYLANKGIYQKIRALFRASASGAGDGWVSGTADTPAQLNGYNAYEASAMANDVTTEDTRFLLFGDFKQFLIVDRLGMTVELNPHVQNGSGRWTGQRSLVAVWRNGSKILSDNAFRVLHVAASS